MADDFQGAPFRPVLGSGGVVWWSTKWPSDSPSKCSASIKLPTTSIPVGDLMKFWGKAIRASLAATWIHSRLFVEVAIRPCAAHQALQT
jgi:hypothetical protein